MPNYRVEMRVDTMSSVKIVSATSKADAMRYALEYFWSRTSAVKYAFEKMSPTHSASGILYSIHEEMAHMEMAASTAGIHVTVSEISNDLP